jgi:hypothetical protein
MRSLSAFLFACILALISFNISTDTNQDYKVVYTGDTKFNLRDVVWKIKSHTDNQTILFISPEAVLSTYDNHLTLSDLKLNLKQSDNKIVSLISKKAVYKRKEDSLVSSKSSSFEIDNLLIESDGFSLENLVNNIKLDFFKPKVFTKGEKPLELIGKANIIEYQHSLNLLVFKGNAEFELDNFTLKAKEIYYDLKRKEIVKSVESKMTNKLK